MDRTPIHRERRLSKRLRQGRVGMARAGDVLAARPKRYRHSGFRNYLSGSRA